MTAIGHIVAALLLLIAGAMLGWLGSALLPASPLTALIGNGGPPPGMAGAPGAGTQPPAPVRLATVEQRLFEDRVRAVGTARAPQAVLVQPLTTGRLAAIHVRSGQEVAAGDLLFELDNRREQAQRNEARARLDDARTRHQRSIAAGEAVPRAQVEQQAAEVAIAEAQLAAAEQALQDTRIRAPFAGTVGLIGPSLGSIVTQQTTLTTLDDRSAVEVEFTLPERYLGSIAIGTPVAARAAGYGERTFAGEIAAIDSRVDRDTRSIRVEALMSGDNELLRPGMFLTVELSLAPEMQVAVPEQSLVIEGGDAFIFLAENGVARRVPVTILKRRDGYAAIAGDVEPDNAVIVAGQARTRDGAPITAVGETPAVSIAPTAQHGAEPS